MTQKAFLTLTALLITVSFGFAFHRASKTSYIHEFEISKSSSASLKKAEAEPFYQERFVSPPNLANFVHAASITEMSNYQLRAVWYGGSRDGSTDLTIYSSVFNNNAWGPTNPITTRKETSSELNLLVKKLGNPVIWTDQNGKLWLFYVNVVFGGWAVSNINFKVSMDNGETFSKAQKIHTSPYLNYSTLVKSKPHQLTDGSIVLPTYHEFIGNMSELLILNQKGQPIDKQRLSTFRQTIQPEVVPISEKKATVLMRCSSQKHPRNMRVKNTKDGGKTWSEIQSANIPNPNSAISSVAVDDYGLIVVFNNHPYNRTNLTLALNRDLKGVDWQIIHTFEQDPNGSFSYPYLIEDSQGDYHLVYTWNSKRIKHITFNKAWIQSKVHQHAHHP